MKRISRFLALIAALTVSISSAASGLPSSTKKFPSALGEIKSVQELPIIKSARSSQFITSSKGYALCATPLWGGEAQCVGINAPPYEDIKFILAPTASGSYSVQAHVQGDEKLRSTYQVLWRSFEQEFSRSRELLDSQIEYTRPRNRSASRMQIAADSAASMVMTQSSVVCEPFPPGHPDYGSVGCPEVIIDGKSTPPPPPPIPPLPQPPGIPDLPPGVPGGGGGPAPEDDQPPITAPSDTACKKYCTTRYNENVNKCAWEKGKLSKMMCRSLATQKYAECLKMCEQ